MMQSLSFLTRFENYETNNTYYDFPNDKRYTFSVVLDKNDLYVIIKDNETQKVIKNIFDMQKYEFAFQDKNRTLKV
jgi:hypothetical protein